MRFIPVKFNMANIAVWQSDVGEALYFFPSSTSVHFLQICQVTDPGADCDGFYSHNFVNDLEFHFYSLALLR